MSVAMNSPTDHVSPIDRAVESLTTFSSSNVWNNEDWHSRFAADIDEEESPQSSHADSKYLSPDPGERIERAQSEGLATENDKEGSEGMGTSVPKDQQLVPKFMPFVRPSTSHEDLSASFSFCKPQSKQLDFSRKISQNPNPSVPITQPEPNSNNITVSAPRHSSTIEPKGTQITQICQEFFTANGAASPLSSAETSPTLVTFAQDVSNQGTRENFSDVVQNSTAQTIAPPKPPSSSVTLPIAADTSHDGADGLVRVSDIATLLAQPASPHALTKVTKLRRKSKSKDAQVQARDLQPAGNKTALSYEDTLSMLLMRYRSEQLERHEAKTALKAKEIELQDLREISNAIYHQLQQGRHREKSQEAELRGLHKIMPQWKDRVKKLSDYVQSLAKDHQTLRGEAEEMRHQQDSLQADKMDITSALKEVRQSVEQDHVKTKKVLVEARHHMEMLEQTVSNQGMQLQEDASLLTTERGRSQQLDGAISKMATDYQLLVEALAEHRKATTEKLDDLLTRSEQVQIVASTPSQDHLEPMLGEAVSLLKELRNANVVKPDDLRKLGASVRSYADRITRSLGVYDQTSASNAVSQKEFASKVLERLHGVSVSITTEHALTEQMTDLREMKATYKERFQASETTLAETRLKVVALQNKIELQSQDISTLEHEVIKARNQPLDSPHTVLRVHELEHQNKDLQQQSEALNHEVAEVSQQLQEKNEDASRTNSQLSELQSQLEELQAEKLLSEEQKITYQSQQNSKLEQTKQELWKAANLEKVKTESNYQNQLHQLRQQKVDADGKLKQKTEELEQVQAEKRAAETEAEESLTSLADLQAERAIQSEASAALESRIIELEKETKEKDQRLAQLDQDLLLAREDLEAKDVRIQRLDATEEKLRLTISELDAKNAQLQKLVVIDSLSAPTNSVPLSTPKDQEQPRRMANRAEKRLPSVVEDSQPADAQTSIVSNPLSPRSSKLTTPSRTKLGQRADTDYLSSPLEDFDDMLDDLGDLAGLFPPTPVPTAERIGSAKKSTTQDVATSHLKASEGVSPPKRLTSSRNSHSTTRKSIHFSQSASSIDISTVSSNALQPKQADISTRNSKHEQNSQHQETVPKQSSRRPSILKESTGDKRSASVAGLNPTDTRSTNKRVKGLGPVIPDSQSPQGSRIPARNHRPAKLNSKKRPKDDKYSRRFSQELSQDL